MRDSEDKLVEILRILSNSDKPVGAKLLSDQLQKKGYNMGERVVRYHLKILDSKGFTERMGYSGRIITDLGRTELKKSLVSDQMNFINSKLHEGMFRTDFDYRTLKGNVITQKSTFPTDDESMEILKTSFENQLCFSNMGNIETIKSESDDEEEYKEIETISAATIEGILLNEGIYTIPTYGGLVKVEDYTPLQVEALISIKEISFSPVRSLIYKDMTNVLGVLNDGEGIVPANFRLIPATSREKVKILLRDLAKIGIGGVLKIGNPGESIFGVPVPEKMFGLAIISGVTPLCSLLELNKDIGIYNTFMTRFDSLKPLFDMKKYVITKNTFEKSHKVQPIIYTAINAMQQIDFNMDDFSGKLATNVSYVKEEDLDDALEILAKSCKNVPDYTSKYYKVINNKYDMDKEFNKGILTLSSVNIDGILNKHKIMCLSKYGGVLEMRKNPIFTEMISYIGSSIDPHEIFIGHKMTDVYGKKGDRKVLASVKEIPYIARDKTKELLKNIGFLGIPIVKIGKPQENIFNSIIDKYAFGIVVGSGLNQTVAINESGIEIKPKSAKFFYTLDEMEML
ncbi:MAG: NrpR regulatory domain-containing protein [Methanobrevibacter sp.]|jgi:repressor of nif and glnA expression|nr:NrpR regulatory domain-containing protein [Candidatus Methanoflexus mossambicus]